MPYEPFDLCIPRSTTVTSHIPDKGQVTVRYYGLCANAHWGKVKKASQVPVSLGMIEEELRPLPSKGRAALIRKSHIGLRSAALMNRDRRKITISIY